MAQVAEVASALELAEALEVAPVSASEPAVGSAGITRAVAGTITAGAAL